VAFRILAVATLLAAAALGLGVVEKSLFVAVPDYVKAVCIGQDVFYVMSRDGAGVAVSALNGSLLGYVKILDEVDCMKLTVLPPGISSTYRPRTVSTFSTRPFASYRGLSSMGGSTYHHRVLPAFTKSTS